METLLKTLTNAGSATGRGGTMGLLRLLSGGRLVEDLAGHFNTAGKATSGFDTAYNKNFNVLQKLRQIKRLGLVGGGAAGGAALANELI